MFLLWDDDVPAALFVVRCPGCWLRLAIGLMQNGGMLWESAAQLHPCISLTSRWALPALLEYTLSGGSLGSWVDEERSKLRAFV